jgi:ABC-type multidrug transport system fused ATPase/permease subunit
MGIMRFSLAGWWHAVVSLPLLLVLFFGWLWRLALWARFLFLMSLLDLHLIPGHPDRVGGLKFVSSSLRGFRLISFALGAIVAGSVMNSQVHHGKQLLDFKNLVFGLLIFLLILFAGPLTIFLKKLRETKRRGVFEYGALAGAVGTQFEAKWLRQNGSLDETSLEVQDFSATTDLYSVTANVYAMQEVPFSFRDLIGPIVLAALLPFLPVVLLSIPLQVIIRGLAKLLF